MGSLETMFGLAPAAHLYGPGSAGPFLVWLLRVIQRAADRKALGQAKARQLRSDQTFLDLPFSLIYMWVS